MRPPRGVWSVKVEMLVRIAADGVDESNSARRRAYASASSVPEAIPEEEFAGKLLPNSTPGAEACEFSRWSNSAAKRFFDCALVLATLPLTVPILMAVGIAVWLTSEGPVFFRQQRVGTHGRLFTIIKFRTILHDADAAYHGVTTGGNQPFTAIGPFLRRWKLDELPQIVNVLRGDMSLVGPRPKIPQHANLDVPCRPGITGAATIAFAREETLLDWVPAHDLENYYRRVVLPAKRHLDAKYMANASFSSDLKLIIDSVFRRWDETIAAQLLTLETLGAGEEFRESGHPGAIPHWDDGVPMRVASLSARLGATHWRDAAP